MEGQRVVAHLEQRFAGAGDDCKGDVAEPYLLVDAATHVGGRRFLRDEAALKFEVLSHLTALDWPKEEKIQVVDHLYSYTLKHQIVLKVDLPRANPKLATVEGVWKVANW